MVLRIGQKAPAFALPDVENKVCSLGELAQDGTVVLAFFPFAFSGACDKEMCAFRDAMPAFQGARARVIGVSVDSTFTLKAFSQTYNLPFLLLSDFNKTVARLYGVLQDSWATLEYKGVAKRSVFVIDKRGYVRYKWVTDTATDEPPYADVVRAAQKLAV